MTAGERDRLKAAADLEECNHRLALLAAQGVTDTLEAVLTARAVDEICRRAGHMTMQLGHALGVERMRDDPSGTEDVIKGRIVDAAVRAVDLVAAALTLARDDYVRQVEQIKQAVRDRAAKADAILRPQIIAP